MRASTLRITDILVRVVFDPHLFSYKCIGDAEGDAEERSDLAVFLFKGLIEKVFDPVRGNIEGDNIDILGVEIVVSQYLQGTLKGIVVAVAGGVELMLSLDIENLTEIDKGILRMGVLAVLVKVSQRTRKGISDTLESPL